jgi:hypothetical protein
MTRGDPRNLLVNAEVPGAKVGDLIFFDWDPNGRADGSVDHVDMITGFQNGAPLLTGQSNKVRDNPWQLTHTGQRVVDTVTSVQAYLVQIVA